MILEPWACSTYYLHEKKYEKSVWGNNHEVPSFGQRRLCVPKIAQKKFRINFQHYNLTNGKNSMIESNMVVLVWDSTLESTKK